MNKQVLLAFEDELAKIAGDLTKNEREDLPKKDFAQPDKEEDGMKGKYPIPDEAHARAALGFAKMHHNAAAYAAIRKKVEKKFPDMDLDA